MARWKYTLKSGITLREAIYKDDMEQVVKCLLLCYRELLDKLDEWDESDYEIDINDSIGVLMAYELYHDEDDEDCVNDYLEEFYDLCDELKARLKYKEETKCTLICATTTKAQVIFDSPLLKKRMELIS